MTQETPTEHSSLVGGSTAARRIGCPGSLKREKIAPKSKGSSYAREGTALHEMMAQILDLGKEPEDMLPFTHNQPPKGVEPAWTLTIDEDKWEDLGAPALEMFDTFLEQLEVEAGEAAALMIEVNGEFPGIPGAFGTSDVIFRAGNIAGVWDWKFGRKQVDAVENPQLMFYFAALRNRFPDFFEGVEELRLCISQPQSDDVEPSVWATDPERIDAFVGELQDAIKLAQTNDAPIERGGWCNFADCKTVCELHVSAVKRLGEMMADREENYTETGAPKVDTDEEGRPVVNALPLDMPAFLSEAMDLAEMAEDWAKHIAGITQEQLELGVPIPGWKIVPKRSAGREWTEDDDTIISKLRSRGLKAADYYTKKLVTPPAAEKALKKLGKELPDDIVRKKPSSGHTLTREGDPRPKAETRNQKAAALGASLLKKLGHEKENENGN